MDIRSQISKFQLVNSAPTKILPHLLNIGTNFEKSGLMLSKWGKIFVGGLFTAENLVIFDRETPFDNILLSIFWRLARSGAMRTTLVPYSITRHLFTISRDSYNHPEPI